LQDIPVNIASLATEWNFEFIRSLPELSYGFVALVKYQGDFLGHGFLILKNHGLKSLPLFPGLAMRELIASALIHQDMTITNAAQATKVMTLALKMELIKPADLDHPRAGYIPHRA
jgi:hypothetical protein